MARFEAAWSANANDIAAPMAIESSLGSASVPRQRTRPWPTENVSKGPGFSQRNSVLKSCASLAHSRGLSQGTPFGSPVLASSASPYSSVAMTMHSNCDID